MPHGAPRAEPVLFAACAVVEVLSNSHFGPPPLPCTKSTNESSNKGCGWIPLHQFSSTSFESFGAFGGLNKCPPPLPSPSPPSPAPAPVLCAQVSMHVCGSSALHIHPTPMCMRCDACGGRGARAERGHMQGAWCISPQAHADGRLGPALLLLPCLPTTCHWSTALLLGLWLDCWRHGEECRELQT